jgi:hypothetical protein
MGAWDPRYLSLDGIQTHRVETDGSTRLRIVGAFYLLDEHGHRMLPVDADLAIKPGAASTIKIAGAESVCDMPSSERRFIAAIDPASGPGPRGTRSRGALSDWWAARDLYGDASGPGHASARYRNVRLAEAMAASREIPASRPTQQRARHRAAVGRSPRLRDISAAFHRRITRAVDNVGDDRHNDSLDSRPRSRPIGKRHPRGHDRRRVPPPARSF